MSWKKVKLGNILIESRIPATNPNPDKRIRVKLNILGVEKRPLENEIEGATKQFIRKSGQFIYGKQNFHKGAFGIVPEELDGFETSADIPSFDVSEDCLVEWVFYFFKIGNRYLELEKLARGVGSKRIHPEQIADIEIPLPNIKEQKLFIDSFKLIESNNNILSTELTNQLSIIKKLRQQLLQDAVQGKLVKQNPKDGNAKDLLEKIKTEKQKLIAEKKLKKEKELPTIKPEEIPFEIPKNWIWCRLGEIIITMIGGGTPSKANSSFWNGNIPWASVKDLNVKYLTDTKDKITALAIKSSSTNLIPQGTVIVCTRMGLGKIVITKIDTAINQDLKALFLSEFIDQEYFYSFYKTLEIIGKGMTVNGIRQEELLNYLIPLPPLAEQTRIVQKLDELMQYCNDLETSIKQSAEQNEKLLQQVLREALKKEEISQ